MTLAFSKIKKIPAYRKLADAILEQILDGRLKEGDPLPTETMIGEMFGLNRATVREGIRVLEELNMIRRENNSKKMYISQPSNDETRAHLERAMVMQEITFGELWEAVVVFEPTIARLAAGKTDETVLAQIDMNIEKTKLAIENGDSLSDLDREFHDLVVTMSRNRVLNFLSGRSLNRFFATSYQKVLSPEGGLSKHDFLESHQAIANAIRSGNADEAEHCMRKHVEDFMIWMKLTGINLDNLMPRIISRVQYTDIDVAQQNRTGR